MAGGKYRSFLVHIKAMSDKGVEESLRPVVRMASAKPPTSKAHTLSSLLQRAQATKVQGHPLRRANTQLHVSVSLHCLLIGVLVIQLFLFLMQVLQSRNRATGHNYDTFKTSVKSCQRELL